MHAHQPSRISRVITLLQETGHALTLSEMAQKLGLPENKLRQCVGSSYDLKVVRIGDKTYDLPERYFIGKIFRYTPSSEEVKNDELNHDSDLAEILTLGCRPRDQVVVVDEAGWRYRLKRSGAKDHLLGFGLTGLRRWYERVHFQVGDDMVFTCQSYTPSLYLLARLPKERRDETRIVQRNEQLADLIYRQLSADIRKWIHLMFVVRKYVFVFPFHDPTPPDHLLRVLQHDSRFLASPKLANDGHPMKEWVVGIKKYFFQNDQGLWIDVFVDKDEIGSFGSCGQCDQRLRWSREYGWRHIEHEEETADCYLSPEFFNFDRPSVKPLKSHQMKRSPVKPEARLVPVSSLPVLQQLFELSLTRFLKIYTALDFQEEEYELNIKPLLGNGVEPRTSIAFLAVISEAIRRNPRKNLTDLNSFVRELQALDHHFPRENRPGFYGSQFLYDVVATREEMGRQQPKNIADFAGLVLKSHQALEEFVTQQDRERLQGKKEFLEAVRDLKLPSTLQEERDWWSPMPREIISVCHHGLDWYFLAAPHLAVRQTPRRAMAITLMCLERFNGVVTGNSYGFFTLKTLLSFSGYQSQSSFSSMVHRPLYDIIYSVQDLSLLLFAPKTAPPDWRQRLKKLAPGLEDP